MKQKILVVLLMAARLVQAQVITASVDASCKPFLFLDGERLTHNGVYKIDVGPQGLKFELNDMPSNKNVMATIKSLDAEVSVKVDTSLFNKMKSFATDRGLNISVNNRRINLNRNFQLTVACSGGSTPITCTFQPHISPPPSAPNAFDNSTKTTAANETGGSDKNLNLPGSIIYDALYLSSLPGEIDGVHFTKIIKYYFGSNVEIGNILDSIKTNNYLNDIIKQPYLDGINRDNMIEGAQSGGLGNVLSNLSLASVGGLDVTAFADGLARFLVKRAKQELGIAFFKKLKDAIRDADDLQIVFPETAQLLDAIDEEIYDYEKYVQNLRESFKKDLVQVHRNLPGLVDNHRDFFNGYPVVKSSLLTGCYIAQQLEDQSHPGDILANYPFEYMDFAGNKNYIGALQTLQLLSASLREPSTEKEGNYWVDIKTIRTLVNNKRALQIYLGLMLQEAKTKFGGVEFLSENLADLLNKEAANFINGFEVYTKYRNYILRFGEKVESLNKMIKENTSANLSDSSALEKYAKYFRISVELIEYCTEATTLPGIKGNVLNLDSLFGKYFHLSYSVSDLVVDINRKNYSAVVNHAINIYNNITKKTAETKPQVAFVASVADSNGLFTGRSKFSTTLKSLVRYGSFIATVATAKTSAEVERAIEAAALPVGSSRVKRVSDFNVSLNGYAGLFYGIEKIQGLDEGRSSPNVYGVAAPVGVAISFGNRVLPFKVKNWSTSLFLSLLDVGAVAAFRFKDDETEQVPTIQLKNIFSPGAFLSLGLGNTPLSFNIGAQVGPNLRKVKVNANEFDDKFYWRFSTSLLVDIPIFNFHTKTK